MRSILLLLAWGFSCIHHLWNNAPPHSVDWFLALNMQQDVQWYIADTGRMLGVTSILVAFCLSAAKWSFKWLVYGLLAVSVIDIIHYWVCYRQNNEVVFLQGIIMIAALLQTSLKTCKKTSKSGKE